MSCLGLDKLIEDDRFNTPAGRTTNSKARFCIDLCCFVSFYAVFISFMLFLYRCMLCFVLKLIDLQGAVHARTGCVPDWHTRRLAEA